MKFLFFFSLIGIVLSAFVLGCFSPSQPPVQSSQFEGDWKGIFGADSASLNLSASSSKESIKGEVVFWNDSLQTVGAFDGVVDRNNIRFSISLPTFSIDGKGDMREDQLVGEFKKWQTIEDEFRMQRIINRGGGNFVLKRKPS